MPPRKKPTTKKPTPKKKATPKTLDKSSPVWTPIRGGFAGTYDYYGASEAPGAAELIGAFANTAYSCSTLIAASLASLEIKLVAETRAGQAAPRSPSSPMRANGVSRRYRTKAVELAEIHDSPALDLLYHPNPDTSYADLVTATSLYLDIVGRAFWLVTDELGLPGRLDLLRSEMVTTLRDEAGRVTGYQVGSDRDGITYPPDRVIAFRRHAQFDPLGEGVSPLRSVWQKVQLSNAELSSWEIVVRQMAQPLVMLTPAPGEVIGPESAERLAKEMTARFWGPGKGGVFVNPDHVEMAPISWPPKDMAGLSLQDVLKTSICNAYHLPRTLLDPSDANFAASKSAERSFQLFCLTPRINYILERVTHCLVRRFDDRLFLVAEDFVEQDEALELQKRQTAITAYQSGIVTQNEARSVFDLDPLPEGGRTYTPPAPAFTLGKSAPVADKYDAYPLRPVVDVLQGWFGEQRDRVLASLKTGPATITKSWYDLDADTSDLAERLAPAVEAYYDAAAKTLITRLGLTDDVWRVVQPKLREAAGKACLQLAQSTNETTSLELEAARTKLRDELGTGLAAGEYVAQLIGRVQKVFERAETERAWLIADTERTRAISASETATAEAAGVKAKVWMADGLACPVCKSLDGTERPINEPFFVDPKGGPYSVCSHPPAHVQCRCTQRYIV